MTMTAPTTVSTHGDCICGGAGMVFVDQDYINRHAAKAAADNGGTMPDGTLEALRDSVLPCYECRPTQYRLWADGHYRAGHSCSTCRPKRKSGGGRRREAA